MLLPEMTGPAAGGDHARHSREHHAAGGGGERLDSPRHVVMTAKSGVWPASAAHMALPEPDEG
jgi:hypothetical protein